MHRASNASKRTHSMRCLNIPVVAAYDIWLLCVRVCGCNLCEVQELISEALQVSTADMNYIYMYVYMYNMVVQELLDTLKSRYLYLY